MNRFVIHGRMLFLTSLIAITFGGCGKKSDEGEDKRSVLDEVEAAKEVSVKIISDENGIVEALVSASSGNTQTVHASESSRIKGTTLYFPPTSFEIDQQVALEEGRTIASRGNLEKLTSEGVIAEAVSTAVSISWTYDDDTYVPYRISLVAPEKPSDPLTSDSQSGSSQRSLVVIYVKNQPGTDDFTLGFFPASKLKVTDTNVIFETKSYGVYQAAWVNAALTEGKEVPADGGGQKAGNTSGQTPAAFGFDPLTASLYGKTLRLQWEPSDMAETYEVSVSTKDANCTEPYVIEKDITTLTKNVALSGAGDQYVCIKARNSAGETAATGSGAKIAVDATPPSVPGKPSAGAAAQSSINVTFAWSASTEVGSSGFSHYFLQIGTSPEASDIFVGDVVDSLSKLIVGDQGKTYYARVKAVDKIGNESEWSPVSDGLTITP